MLERVIYKLLCCVITVLRYTQAMITEKQCENKLCDKGEDGEAKLFLATKRGRFCCDRCRVDEWQRANKKEVKNDK